MVIFIICWCVCWCLFLGHVYRSIKALRSLDDFPDILLPTLPSVSIIVAVKDDASEIGHTLEVLLSSSYPHLEVIAVNDRSRDDTGEIIDRMKLSSDRLKVMHLKELPAGWFGQVHGLHQGSTIATGDFLLFSQADVSVKGEVLAKAVAICESLKLDHLSVFPKVAKRGFWLNLLMSTSNILYTSSGRPWLSIENRPHHCVRGVGPFNLVRRTSFEKSEGFEWLRMDVANDNALALLMARKGGRSLLIKSGEKVRIDWPWYPTFKSMVFGLEKNAVGGLANYRPFLIFMMCSLSFLTLLVPTMAFLAGHFFLVGIIILATTVFASRAHKVIDYSFITIIFFPLGLTLLAYALLRSAYFCFKQGGIIWSGTLYPLKELRDGIRVRFRL